MILDFAGHPWLNVAEEKTKAVKKAGIFQMSKKHSLFFSFVFFLRIEFFHKNRMQIKIMEALCLWRFSPNQISRMVTSPRCE